MTRRYEPRRISVTVVGDGFYLAREADGEPIYVPSPASDQDLHEWTLSLEDTELEAAVQIYYDRWTFQSGEKCDKDALEALEHERNRRQLPHSTWAPGIFARMVKV